MFRSELFQNFGIRTWSCLGLLNHSQPKLIEQDVRQLLGAIRIEFLSRQLHDFAAQGIRFQLKLAAQLLKPHAINTNPLVLQLGQHAHEWDLETLHHIDQFFISQSLLHRGDQPVRNVDVFACIRGNVSDGNLVHRNLSFARTDQGLGRDFCLSQPTFGNVIQIMIASSGVQEIVRDHCVKSDDSNRHVVRSQNDRIVFNILPDKDFSGICQ